MGTRCETLVTQRTYTDKNEWKKDELFRFYRHWDGYPDGHGLDMAKACVVAEEIYKPKPGEVSYYNCLTNRNWCQRAFQVLFDNETDMEVEPHDALEHCDIEFLYEVCGDYDDWGGKHSIERLPVTIAVWKVTCGWDEENIYDTTMAEEPMFKGNPHEYIEWVKNWAEQYA